MVQRNKKVDQRYLIRAKIAAARKARKKAIQEQKKKNKYVVSRKSAKKLSNKSRRTTRITPIKSKPNPKLPPPKPLYSGTIIYDGKASLHPTKWTPSDPENSPGHYKWESLLTGTHILDKNTCLTWIVNSKNGLDLAPCQTIKLEMNLPDDFDPGLSLNPYLPELDLLPAGTRFIFQDCSTVFFLSESTKLEPQMTGEYRTSQIIPIAMNSLYNTQKLYGLNTPIIHSSLQHPQDIDGYQTLYDWFNGLIRGDQDKPGYLGHLPRVEQLQAYDVIEFYDPNLLENPKVNMKNPDGSEYIDGLHESKYFFFRMQIVLDKKKRLTGQVITQPNSPMLCNINIPVEHTNQERPVYIRSATLVPLVGDPICVFSKIDDPYYMDKDGEGERMVKDFRKGLLDIGYPYQQIRASYLERINDFYVIRFGNLPSHLWGIVLSSDNHPMNKYQGSGRFYLGYSSNEMGSCYSCHLENETGLILEKLIVEDIMIDGVLIELDNQELDLKHNCNIGTMMRLINRRLGDIGYPGYSLNIWWNEGDHQLKFYLSGVTSQNIPSIMININGEMISLDFINSL